MPLVIVGMMISNSTKKPPEGGFAPQLLMRLQRLLSACKRSAGAPHRGILCRDLGIRGFFYGFIPESPNPGLIAGIF
jgi:hypothetical protein